MYNQAFAGFINIDDVNSWLVNEAAGMRARLNVQNLSRKKRVAILAAALIIAGTAAAMPYVMQHMVYGPAAEKALARLHQDELILEAVRAQNVELKNKDEAWAIAHDALWAAEKKAGGGPVLEATLTKLASSRLREIIAATGGVVRHVIVMDEGGRVAAVPWPSFNFWQKPKAKFQNTFLLGKTARHVNRLERGHDGTFIACWLSETLIDPVTQQPIGAIGLELDHAYVGKALCTPT
jgi:hypothetical protein